MLARGAGRSPARGLSSIAAAPDPFVWAFLWAFLWTSRRGIAPPVLLEANGTGEGPICLQSRHTGKQCSYACADALRRTLLLGSPDREAQQRHCKSLPLIVGVLLDGPSGPGAFALVRFAAWRRQRASRSHREGEWKEVRWPNSRGLALFPPLSRVLQTAPPANRMCFQDTHGGPCLGQAP